MEVANSLEAEFARVRAELAELKDAGTDPDAPYVPVVKHGDGRTVIPAMPNFVPAELSAGPCRSARRIRHGRHQSNSGIDHEVVRRSRAPDRDFWWDGLESSQVWSEMRCDLPCCVSVCARYGLWGVRVGEASNPGPPSLRRYRRGRHAFVLDSSDEEQLVCNRNVVPRVFGADSVADGMHVETSQESRATVVPSDSALAVAGREFFPDLLLGVQDGAQVEIARSEVAEPRPPETVVDVFPMTDDAAVPQPSALPQCRRLVFPQSLGGILVSIQDIIRTAQTIWQVRSE